MSPRSTIDHRAASWAAALVLAVLAVAVVGSGFLRWFDAALVGYLFGTVFAVFGVAYRYVVWLRRPPTAMLNRRGWESFRAKGRRGPQRRSRCPGWWPRTCSPRGSSASARGHGGSPTSWCSGAASWPHWSPSRSCSACCTSSRSATTAAATGPTPARVGTFSFDSRERRRLGHLPPARHRRGARARRRVHLPAAGGCATPARWPSNARTTSSRWPGCSRCRSPASR